MRYRLECPAAVNSKLLVRLQKKHVSQRCHVELVELTVDNVWQIADAGDPELQRLARNIRRGNVTIYSRQTVSIVEYNEAVCVLTSSHREQRAAHGL